MRGRNSTSADLLAAVLAAVGANSGGRGRPLTDQATPWSEIRTGAPREIRTPDRLLRRQFPDSARTGQWRRAAEAPFRLSRHGDGAAPQLTYPDAVSGPPPTDVPLPISEERRRLVEAAQRTWIQKLIDLSRRNSLLYFRHWKLASAELRDWDQTALLRLLAGESVPLIELLPAEPELARRTNADPAAAGELYTEEGDDEFSSE